MPNENCDPTKLTILVVDDDLINRKLALKLLEKYKGRNPTIFQAKDGKEALEVLNNEKEINLILLDLQMPIMTGMEFLQERANDEKLSEIPVIVLTTDETRKQEALELGATDFLTKPVKEAILFDTLDLLKVLFEDD